MIVIKIGGAEGIDYDLVADDIAYFASENTPMLVIHGGSALTNAVATALGHPPEFVTSISGYPSRRTDRRTLEIFEMVYCGQINKGLVERLQSRGVNAIGLSGLDGRLWEGRRKNTILVRDADGRRRVIRDDYTGRVEKVNTTLLRSLMEAGYLPVLTPPAISYEGEAINVDGDRAAAITASALDASRLIILSNVPGLLKNYPDPSSLIKEIPADHLDEFMSVAHNRMKKKVLGAKEAIVGGVHEVIFASACVPQPIRNAIAGHGTIIR